MVDPGGKGRKRGTGGPRVRVAPGEKAVLLGRPWRNRENLGTQAV